IQKGGLIRRSDFERIESGRATGTAADQIRTGDQSQNCKGARPHRAGQCARPRRRGDRMMTRREFIALLGGAAATWPLAARPPQPPLPVIGFLRDTSLADATYLVAAFRQGLKEAGFVEGQNVAIEYRSAEDQGDRLPDIVADLARQQVALIVCNTASA